MIVIRAPLRASGETLGPVSRIGRRWCLGVVLLREGVVVFARGVIGVRFGDVGCLVVAWAASLVRDFSCVFSLFGSSISCLSASATMSMSLVFVP